MFGDRGEQHNPAEPEELYRQIRDDFYFRQTGLPAPGQTGMAANGGWVPLPLPPQAAAGSFDLSPSGAGPWNFTPAIDWGEAQTYYVASEHLQITQPGRYLVVLRVKASGDLLAANDFSVTADDCDLVVTFVQAQVSGGPLIQENLAQTVYTHLHRAVTHLSVTIPADALGSGAPGSDYQIDLPSRNASDTASLQEWLLLCGLVDCGPETSASDPVSIDLLYDQFYGGAELADGAQASGCFTLVRLAAFPPPSL